MRKLPLLFFIAIVAFFAVVMLKGGNPAIVPSVMIGKPAPMKLQGPTVVNFFASWCLECRSEQATLAEIKSVPVIGIAYKDAPEKLTPWLKKHGNPYKKIMHDSDGKMAIDWGVYGVPETFIVDAHGVIRYKQTGAVTEDVYQREIKPLLMKLRKETTNEHE